MERLRRIIKNCWARIPRKIAIVSNPEELIQLAEHTVVEETPSQEGSCASQEGSKSQNTLLEIMGPKVKFLAILPFILCYTEMEQIFAIVNACHFMPSLLPYSPDHPQNEGFFILKKCVHIRYYLPSVANFYSLPSPAFSGFLCPFPSTSVIKQYSSSFLCIMPLSS